MHAIQQPLVWIPLLGIILAIVFSIAAVTSRGGIRRGVLSTAAAACLLVPAWLLVAVFFPELIDARYRAYKSFYRDIQPGMTREQVFASLDKHYPANGPRKRPAVINDTAGEMGFFMNPENSREPNCEGIFLDLAGGRVTRKHYSRD